MSSKKHIPKLESIERITKIPVIETGVNIATDIYGKIKNSNRLMKWYLGTVVEGGVTFVVETSLNAVPLLELPITVADSIVCEVLDTVQQRVPAINYPPEKIINKTKDYVSANIVQPVLKRAESAKEFTVNGATKYGELAATKIDTALDVADQYVDKYLPDSSEPSEGKVVEKNGESKAIQTIDHVNRLSRKLQRRLTKRTIAEAKALRRQGADAAQILLKLAELMVKDPKQFAAKIKAIWQHLSQDEPENQVPPANLEQLIALITRETARRFVHITNYSVSKASQLPGFTLHTIQFLAHQANVLLDQVLKTVHLERVKTFAVSRAQSQIRNLNVTLREVQLLVENLLSGLLSRQQKHHQHSRGQERPIPLHTLSPVAQSPERTQETKPEEPIAKNHSNERHEHSKQNSPKKQKKSKAPSNTSQHPSEHQSLSPQNPEEKHLPDDENRNRQEVSNGEIPKSFD